MENTTKTEVKKEAKPEVKKEKKEVKVEVKPEVVKSDVFVTPVADAADAVPVENKIKARAGRIIIRNIQFDMKKEHLMKEFGKYGTIVETNVPVKSGDVHNRGFGFIEFDSKETAQKAIDAMNNEKWKGRTLSLEFSVPKGTYETRIEGVVKHTNLKKEEAVLPKVLRDEKKETMAIKEKEEAVKKKFEEKNATKIKSKRRKKPRSNRRKRGSQRIQGKHLIDHPFCQEYWI